MSEVKVVPAPIVRVVARTKLDPHGIRLWLSDVDGTEWDRIWFGNQIEPWGYRDAGSGQDVLVEAAARACYWSYNRGRGHADHIANLREQGHTSTFEHVSWTFAIAGVSRSLTHELVRHRVGVAISQMSQRYCGPEVVRFVCPPAIYEADDPVLYSEWVDSCGRAMDAYTEMLARIREEMPEAKRKQVYEAARSVLPNCTETRLFWTLNGQALRHVLEKRGSPGADAEFRRLATQIARIVKAEAPQLFADVRIDDGIVEVGP